VITGVAIGGKVGRAVVVGGTIVSDGGGLSLGPAQLVIKEDKINRLIDRIPFIIQIISIGKYSAS
jgi:hypothetical protein